nr:hypothetical protein [Rhizobium leguminosarum]
MLSLDRLAVEASLLGVPGLVAVRKDHVFGKLLLIEVGHRAAAITLPLRTGANMFSVGICHSLSPFGYQVKQSKPAEVPSEKQIRDSKGACSVFLRFVQMPAQFVFVNEVIGFARLMIGMRDVHIELIRKCERLLGVHDAQRNSPFFGMRLRPAVS